MEPTLLLLLPTVVSDRCSILATSGEAGSCWPAPILLGPYEGCDHENTHNFFTKVSILDVLELIGKLIKHRTWSSIDCGILCSIGSQSKSLSVHKGWINSYRFRVAAVGQAST